PYLLHLRGPGHDGRALSLFSPRAAPADAAGKNRPHRPDHLLGHAPSFPMVRLRPGPLAWKPPEHNRPHRLLAALELSHPHFRPRPPPAIRLSHDRTPLAHGTQKLAA